MINNRFLYYKTLSSFLRDLNSGQINDKSIVFIENTKTIWTHGIYFGGNFDSALDNYYTKEQIDNILSINTDTLLIILQLLQYFEKDGELTASILELLSTKANSNDVYTKHQIDEMFLTHTGGINHVFMSLREYDALEEYDPNTIYMIVGSSSDFRFGDKFPITFGWAFGGRLPLTFINNEHE